MSPAFFLGVDPEGLRGWCPGSKCAVLNVPICRSVDGKLQIWRWRRGGKVSSLINPQPVRFGETVEQSLVDHFIGLSISRCGKFKIELITNYFQIMKRF